MCKKLTNSLTFRGTEDYQYLWKRPLPKEFFRVKSECMRKSTLQKSLSKDSGAICTSHSHNFVIFGKTQTIEGAGTFLQHCSRNVQANHIDEKWVVLVWLCPKIHWLKNHCKMLITLDFLGTEIHLYVQRVKIPFFINVGLSTKVLAFLVQNIPERRKGEFII